jgi:anhydro-N-acetylmuramic acid kinase
MTKPLCALGLMSGTSMDGIDVAMITTDGEDAVTRGPGVTFPYPPEFRTRLRTALTEAATLTARDQRPGSLAATERELNKRHAEAVERFITQFGVARDSIDLIGLHGQTVLHRPADRLTVQLGDGPLLAQLTGIDVVYDLRAADVAAGGQGAPMVPVYHRALASLLPERPVAFLNLGGVANITWVGADGRLIAFDTGPGNAPIDDFVRARTGQPYDDGGQLAASGEADGAVVAGFLRQPYFREPPPKSLDRNAFAIDLSPSMSTADGAATLAMCAAMAVAQGTAWLPAPPALWLVSGGGRHNRGLMQALEAALNAKLLPAEEVGLDGDSIEAEAWAYLAVRSLRGLALSFPMTTGAPTPMTGGLLARGKA